MTKKHAELPSRQRVNKQNKRNVLTDSTCLCIFMKDNQFNKSGQTHISTFKHGNYVYKNGVFNSKTLTLQL